MLVLMSAAYNYYLTGAFTTNLHLAFDKANITDPNLLNQYIYNKLTVK